MKEILKIYGVIILGFIIFALLFRMHNNELLKDIVIIVVMIILIKENS